MVYIHFNSEKSANYHYRKNAKISNEKLKMTPFIPPLLFNKFVDLSKNTFNERKCNPNLKTQIRVGNENLIILVKNKGDKEWELEPNLEAMGDIAEPQWHKVWPAVYIPELTSPSKG